MKICCICREEKALSDFSKAKANKDGLQNRCRACARDWYQAHKASHIEAVNKRNKRIIAENQINMIAYLEAHPCVDCGESDIIVLEFFDHRDPSIKHKCVSYMATSGAYIWESVLREIEKCDVVCANCHRKRTNKQFGWYRYSLMNE
jgi:hypothetical protein